MNHIVVLRQHTKSTHDKMQIDLPSPLCSLFPPGLLFFASGVQMSVGLNGNVCVLLVR